MVTLAKAMKPPQAYNLALLTLFPPISLPINVMIVIDMEIGNL